MNTKQLEVWEQLVRQCRTQYESRFYSSINVASWVRSDAIIAAGALVELVTPDLVALLERLAEHAGHMAYEYDGLLEFDNTTQDKKDARALAARIWEALALEVNE